MPKKIIQVLFLAPFAVILFFAGWCIQYAVGIGKSKQKVKARKAINL